MSKVVKILVELLCHISSEPEGGHHQDVSADLQIDTWQALIHDLSHAEKELVKKAIQDKLKAMQELSSLTFEQEDLMAILDAFVHDELH